MKKHLVYIGIWTAVWVFWSLLELLFYGERQPRVVDDVIGFILTCSLYLNYKLLSGDDKDDTDIGEEALNRMEEKDNDTRRN